MDKKRIKVWYDSEGDYLEVIFAKKSGYFRSTKNDLIMEKVDKNGHVIGFSVQNVSTIKKRPVEVTIPMEI